GVAVHSYVVAAQAALIISKRSANDRLDVLDRERLKFKDLAAADQRAIHREKWIARRRPDQRHNSFFHVRQERVLLSLVEAVDFVDEQQRALASAGQPVASLFEKLAQVLHAAGHGRELPKSAFAFSRQQASKRRFAGAGWTVE